MRAMGKIRAAFMHLLGIQRVGNQRPVTSGSLSPVVDEEIPRYPPFMKGLPAAPVERILATQTELIQSIEDVLSLPEDLYQTIAAPVILRYAAFSHLLPASESHHHRGAGGLFRHGLEVALWATQAAQGCLFATDATPKERKQQELRWRLAVCFAGLLHDIGKPVSDIAVVDRLGQHTWNPCDENLTDWAEQHHIEHYFLRWRDNRHKRHEQFSALVLERVLTREARTFLLTPGPDIMQAMLETIHGLDRGSKLYTLVMEADCNSVERDLKAHYHSIDSAMGMPVEKYLFDAMRRLVKSGQWLVNEKGARLWRFKEGLHIVWRTGAQDIVELLAKDKVPGIPRDEDTLADILIERGMAIPKQLPDGRSYRYWRMQPQGLEVVLYMLRLVSAEFVFSNEPPVIIDSIEVDELAETLKTKSSEGKDVNLEDTPTPPLAVNLGVVVATAQINKAPIADGNTEYTLPNVPEEVAETKAIFPSSTTVTPVKQTKQVETSVSPNHPKLKKLSPPKKDNIPSAREWLQLQGVAGEWLIQIVDAINSNTVPSEYQLLLQQDKYLLPFPVTAEYLAIDPALLIKSLEDKGWLVTDVLSPMRKVQVINQVRGILLSPEPSGFLRALLTETKRLEEVHPSSLEPKHPRPATKSAKQSKLSSNPQTETILAPQAPQPKSEARTDSKVALSITPAVNTDNATHSAVTSLIDYLRKTKLISNTAPDNHWQELTDTEITQFLKQHSGLKRSSLLREMASHPDCLLENGRFKIKIMA